MSLFPKEDVLKNKKLNHGGDLEIVACLQKKKIETYLKKW
jgi:hypothetical protein